MNKNKRTKKEEAIKYNNYLYAILILIGGILLVLYVFKWYQVKKDEKLMSSYLVSTKTINSRVDNLDYLKQIMQESPSSYFIYLSYTGNESVYNFEKKLKRVIDKYKLNDLFYYIDVTKIMEDANYLDDIRNSLNIEKLDNIPAIIYVHNGKISNILDGENNTFLKIEDLEQLLNDYEFEIVK